MEYCTGGELFDYIVKHKRLKEKEACKFYQQIIAGIEYIHKLGISHRDLKPENLLLDNHKNIRIVDFGLSNLFKPGELLKTACGSPCYAAPEMIAGKKYMGNRVDIWSSGVVLYAIVCGYLPFEDPNTGLLYKKILSGEFKVPEFISFECKDLMKNVLNIDPDRRFSIEQIKRSKWFGNYTQELAKGIIVGEDPIPIDEQVLAQLGQHNLNIESARKSIESNTHNQLTTSYYLLLKKQSKFPNTTVFRLYESFESSTRSSRKYLNMTMGYAPQPPRSKPDTYIFRKHRRYRDSTNTDKPESTGGSSSKEAETFVQPRFIEHRDSLHQPLFNVRNLTLSPKYRNPTEAQRPEIGSQSPTIRPISQIKPRSKNPLVKESLLPLRDTMTPMIPRPPSRFTPTIQRQSRGRTHRVKTPNLSEGIEDTLMSVSFRISPRRREDRLNKSMRAEKGRTKKAREFLLKL